MQDLSRDILPSASCLARLRSRVSSVCLFDLSHLDPGINTLLIEDVISNNATIQSLVANSSKPSFLLSDKVYQKVIGEDDQTWLLRAAESTLLYFHNELSKNESSRCV